MGKYNGRHLLKRLDSGSDSGIFGIAYSILTTKGLLKGLGISPSSWAKVISKSFENGHATAFMIDKKQEQITMTGMSDDGWVFYGGYLETSHWARSTGSATTDVYYTSGDDLISRFKEAQARLENAPVSYGVIAPNTPLTPRYENCVSSTHYVVYEMGLGSWASAKGFWIPSLHNNITWAATKFSSWKHRRFENCNTHIPD